MTATVLPIENSITFFIFKLHTQTDVDIVAVINLSLLTKIKFRLFYAFLWCVCVVTDIGFLWYTWALKTTFGDVLNEFSRVKMDERAFITIPLIMYYHHHYLHTHIVSDNTANIHRR